MRLHYLLPILVSISLGCEIYSFRIIFHDPVMWDMFVNGRELSRTPLSYNNVSGRQLNLSGKIYQGYVMVYNNGTVFSGIQLNDNLDSPDFDDLSEEQIKFIKWYFDFNPNGSP